ncbi:hypothetical protein C8Q78DRAFT_1019675 [Trametes maxima]|nr:hypothetical protein C8Q78DRAFT_1019675 [Trametes maxima]
MVAQTYPLRRLKVFLLLAAAHLHVVAKVHTVDDTDPSIQYSPANQWSQGATCSGCAIHPEAQNAFKGTWHDTTYHPDGGGLRSFSFTFNGTSVRVFNILPGALPSPPVQGVTSHVDLAFELDGHPAEPPLFTYDPDGDTFQYRAAVFSSGPLVNTEHTLVVSATTGVESVILFDYIEYTTPDSPVIPTPGAISITSISATTSTTTTLPNLSTTGILSVSPIPQLSMPSLSPTLITLATFSGSSIVTIVRSSVITIAPPPSTSTTMPSPEVAQSSSIGPVQSSLPAGSTISGIVSTQTIAASTRSTIPTGAVIGGAVGGGLLLLSLLSALLYMLCKRRALRFRLRDNVEHSDEGGGGVDEMGWLTVDPSSTTNPSLPAQSRPAKLRSNSWRSRDPFLDPLSFPSHMPALSPHNEQASPVSETRTSSEESVVVISGATVSSPEQNVVGDEKALLCGSEPESISPPEPAQVIPTPTIADARVLAQLAALQEEVARIRVDQQTSVLIAESPPQYGA